MEYIFIAILSLAVLALGFLYLQERNKNAGSGSTATPEPSSAQPSSEPEPPTVSEPASNGSALAAEDELKLDMITREIHHRVKNNFQTVSSLLNLQTRYLSDKLAKDILWESQNRIKSMALIHQQLYQREETGSISMTDYLDELVEELTYSYNAEEKGVTIKAEVESMELHAEVAVPLGLIVHELVLNSFKYAFPESREGVILIKLWREGGQLHLIVSDDGVGLPEGMEPLKVKTSYGMRLVILFTQELKGEVRYESEKDKGTQAIFHCPVSETVPIA